MTREIKKEFYVQSGSGGTKKYSQGRILQKLLVGELKPSDMLLGQDGEWHPIAKTPGFRSFCEKLESKGSEGTQADGGSTLQSMNLKGMPKAEKNAESAWEGFQLDEEDETLTGQHLPPLLPPELKPPAKEKQAAKPEPLSPSRKVPKVEGGPSKVKARPPQKEPGLPNLEALLPKPETETKKMPAVVKKNPAAGKARPPKEEEDSQGYTLVPERESRVAKKIRRAAVASYSPKEKTLEWDWFGTVMKLVFWGGLLLVGLLGGPRLADWAAKEWDRRHSPVQGRPTHLKAENDYHK